MQISLSEKDDDEGQSYANEAREDDQSLRRIYDEDNDSASTSGLGLAIDNSDLSASQGTISPVNNREEDSGEEENGQGKKKLDAEKENK